MKGHTLSKRQIISFWPQFLPYKIAYKPSNAYTIYKT